jgi:hypothetical protein
VVTDEFRRLIGMNNVIMRANFSFGAGRIERLL